MTTLLLIVVSLLAGGLGMLAVKRFVKDAPTHITSVGVTERVRSVGRLIGLEVHAKEIATSTKGWSWVPPILLSQAKLAMIFHFEKQYSVDLARIDASSVTRTGHNRYRVILPPIEGSLRLTDVTPYDIQAGRILGLLDVIQMNAQTQGALMQSAQEQASALYAAQEARYLVEAKRSVEKQIASLLGLLEIEAEIEWASGEPSANLLRLDREIESRLGFQKRKTA